MPSLVAALLRGGLITSLTSVSVLPMPLLDRLSRCRYRVRLMSC